MPGLLSALLPIVFAQQAVSMPAAQATRFVVDLSNDSSTGVCRANRSSSGRCNLRAAVRAAAATHGAVEIDLAVDSVVSGGEMAIDAPAQLTIVASGPRQIVGSQSSRLFTVGSAVTLVLHDVTVKNFATMDYGGALVNHGDLELLTTTFSDNQARCSGGGVQSASAYCGGGAISNDGLLTIRSGSVFENNTVDAQASTATFTYSSASGGAIVSNGSVIVDGPVFFMNNQVRATSTSGWHPIPAGGANASAGGGAIYNGGGRLEFVPSGIRGCVFASNAATAEASSPVAPGSATSVGGAIVSQGTLILQPGACTFVGNQAQTDPDVHVQP